MKTQTFLVIVDDTEEHLIAMRYAAQRAHALQGRVALLYIVEPVGIEAWRGVEKAVLDEAFAEARKHMATHEAFVKEVSGTEPLTFYRKGETSTALIDFIEEQDDITTLVLAAQKKDGGRNPLVQYVMSDKGLKKLKIPCTVVPQVMRDADKILPLVSEEVVEEKEETKEEGEA